jgi:hypothetical protein
MAFTMGRCVVPPSHCGTRVRELRAVRAAQARTRSRSGGGRSSSGRSSSVSWLDRALGRSSGGDGGGGSGGRKSESSTALTQLLGVVATVLAITTQVCGRQTGACRRD